MKSIDIATKHLRENIQGHSFFIWKLFHDSSNPFNSYEEQAVDKPKLAIFG